MSLRNLCAAGLLCRRGDTTIATSDPTKPCVLCNGVTHPECSRLVGDLGVPFDRLPGRVTEAMMHGRGATVCLVCSTKMSGTRSTQDSNLTGAPEFAAVSESPQRRRVESSVEHSPMKTPSGHHRKTARQKTSHDDGSDEWGEVEAHVNVSSPCFDEQAAPPAAASAEVGAPELSVTEMFMLGDDDGLDSFDHSHALNEALGDLDVSGDDAFGLPAEQHERQSAQGRPAVGNLRVETNNTNWIPSGVDNAFKGYMLNRENSLRCLSSKVTGKRLPCTEQEDEIIDGIIKQHCVFHNIFKSRQSMYNQPTMAGKVVEDLEHIYCEAGSKGRFDSTKCKICHDSCQV